MKLEILKKALEKHGQFASMEYISPLKLKKDNPFGEIKQRTVVKGIQIGAQYDNKKDIKEARINGQLPSENQGLNGVEWVVYPHILRNPKTNSLQLRYYINDNTKYETEYEDGNGKKIDINEIKPFMYAKKSRPSIDNTRNIIIDKIVKLV